MVNPDLGSEDVVFDIHPNWIQEFAHTQARGNSELEIFRGYTLSWQSNFLGMHFRADFLWDYEISGRWVSGLWDLTIKTNQPEPTNLKYLNRTNSNQPTQTDQHQPNQTNQPIRMNERNQT